MTELEVDLNGVNPLAAALRYGIRCAAAEHRITHRQLLNGCEGCHYVVIAASLKTTQAEDDAWSAANRGPA